MSVKEKATEVKEAEVKTPITPVNETVAPANVVPVAKNEVAPVKVNFVTAMIEAQKAAFLEANAGLELDFVRLGQRIKLSKTAKFVLASDDKVVFGDILDVVIAKGEVRYILWGEEDSPEDGLLITAEKTEEEAATALLNWLEDNPEAKERYAPSDIKINYCAMVVPVNTLSPEEMPDIYTLFFPQTGSYSFGQYAMEVFKGDKAKSISRGSGVNTVVTRIANKSETKGKNEWLTFTFEAVGPFKPEDFGITQ